MCRCFLFSFPVSLSGAYTLYTFSSVPHIFLFHFECIFEKRERENVYAWLRFICTHLLCSFRFSSSIQMQCHTYGNWDYGLVYRPPRIVFMHFQCVSKECFNRVSFTRAYIFTQHWKRALAQGRERAELVDMRVSEIQMTFNYVQRMKSVACINEMLIICSSQHNIRMEFSEISSRCYEYRSNKKRMKERKQLEL